MNFKEKGFRAFYHHFTAVALNDRTRRVIRDFPGAGDAEYILTYGYIDRQRGLTLEILAAARRENGHFYFMDGNETVRSFVRIEVVEEDTFWYFPDEDGILEKRYAAKIEMLKSYDASEEVEQTREMGFLDQCRDPQYVDDVLVYMIKENLEPEGCWVRITGRGEDYLIGTLLHDPVQDFGYHNGDTIGFFVRRRDEDTIICCCDVNPSRKLTREDLEDGSMLEAAVAAFNRERDRDHFLEVLEILRDSYVWVPCTAVMSERDRKRMEELIESVDGDLDALEGKELANCDEVRLVPDILQNEGNYFFPVFSTQEAMGEYGKDFSKIQYHMLEVFRLARNNKMDIRGIVLNAFTEPIVIDAEIWDLVENMKSRINDHQEENREENEKGN